MIVTSHTPGTPSWVDLETTDVPEAVEFYSGLLGWSAAPELGPEAGGYRMMLLKDEPVAAITPMTPNSPAPPHWNTYVTVASADETAQAITKAGGTIVAEPFDVLSSGRMAVASDPSGAFFSIWEPKEDIGARIVNEPGSMVWNELNTRQAEASARFYGEVFGWKVRLQEGGPMVYREILLGDHTVGGIIEMTEEWGDLPPHWMVYFAVDDADATAAKATELGGSVQVPPTDIPPGRFSVIGDGAGAHFSVIRLAAPM